jgi:hypothetical protein
LEAGDGQTAEVALRPLGFKQWLLHKNWAFRHMIQSKEGHGQ